MQRRRLKKKPFYKKSWFILVIVLIVLLALGAIAHYTSDGIGNNHNSKTEQTSKNKNKKSSNNKTEKKKIKSTQKSKKVTGKKSTINIKNPGTYKDLTYDTDYFTFKLYTSVSDVKLIKDTDGYSAFWIKYNYTNKTKVAQIPSKVQKENIFLKQGDKDLLTYTKTTGSDQSLIDAANKPVQPGKSVDAALMIRVNDTKTTIDMQFNNIKDKTKLSDSQPFKL